MKQFLLLIGAFLLTTASFAESQSSKNSLQAFGSAWLAPHYIHPQHDKNDIAMVYGGADISHRPFTTAIATA